MSAAIEVETSAGRLRGSRGADGIGRFLGIPFAAPPTGPLRFLAPQPVQPWTGVRDALHPSACAPQRNTAGPLGEMIGIAPGTTDEDCLYLNVWTPDLSAGPRPVLVWIHGGGNLVGSGTQPRMDGARMAARGDVVVVTLNYRLGVLGFLHAPQLGATGNEALLDQLAALRWVRREIAAFGGDPTCVTVFGQSAGGFDIAELLVLPEARGSFDRAIAMSGSLRPRISREQAARTAHALAEPFGGLARLRDVPVEALLDRQAELARTPLGGEHRFAPTQDGELIARDALAAICDGHWAQGMPLLLGTTRHEHNLFSAFDPRTAALDPAGLQRRAERLLGAAAREAIEGYSDARRARGEPVDPPALWNALMTDETFRIPAVRLAQAHGAKAADTFLYRFDRESPALDGRLRACHSIDVPFVFGTHRLPGLQTLLGSDADLDALSQRIMDAWIAFARSGSPRTPALPDWPCYSPAGRAVLCLDRACRTQLDPEGEERRIWEKLEQP